MVGDEFRLRTFVDRLAEHDELLAIDDEVQLGQVAAHLEREPRAIVFRDIGGKGEELVGNVMGSRSRLALALGTTPGGALAELRARLARPGEVRVVESADAPVHQVVQTGDQVDLTEFPVHLQHEYDGAPYISAAYDVSRKANPEAFNLGCRRLMLRGPRTTGVDLNAPSDLRVRYMAAVEKGERLPVAFVVGSHPLDYLGATMQGAEENELLLLSSLRAAPLPVVRCVTQDVLVPADSEIVLEGYLDSAGYTEREGPYGEYMGYYGESKLNPLFHVTAVTRRRDALFQTVTISGRHLARTDTAQLAGLATEVKLWEVLSRAVRQPVAVYDVPASGGISNNVLVSIRSVYPGEGRNAIAAILGACDIKTVMVTDDDIDIFSDEQIDWAMATRYQPDRDTVVLSGLRTTPLDPSVRDMRAGGAKLGLDLTRGVGQSGRRWSVPEPPSVETEDGRTARPVLEVLGEGPATFAALMRAANTADGRELVRQLDDALRAGTVGLDAEGTWRLIPAGTD
jgi:2,5-furandicarboxylate decarboxylase 1